MNDVIVRTLAGVPQAGAADLPEVPYHGPEVMEELVAYDPHLVAGILGGSAGTTYDAFFLLEDARRHGARAALFGRKINNSEHQLTFVRHLRAIADGEVDARRRAAPITAIWAAGDHAAPAARPGSGADHGALNRPGPRHRHPVPARTPEWLSTPLALASVTGIHRLLPARRLLRSPRHHLAHDRAAAPSRSRFAS